MKAKVYINYKEGILDPQGATVNHALKSMGYEGISEIQIGKLIEIKFEKISKKVAEVSIDASKKVAEASLDAGIKAKDQSIKFGKKYIREKAIESIREKLEFAQKKESDFTKEQMRKMIAKEEKKIIKSLGLKGAFTTILALFGITNV